MLEADPHMTLVENSTVARKTFKRSVRLTHTSTQCHLNTLRIFEKSSVQRCRRSPVAERAKELFDSMLVSAALRAITTHTDESLPSIGRSARSSRMLQLRFLLSARSATTGLRSRFRFEILKTSIPSGASFDR